MTPPPTAASVTARAGCDGGNDNEVLKEEDLDEGGSLHGHLPAVGVGVGGHKGGTHGGESAAGGDTSAGVRLLLVDEDALEDLLDTPGDGG